MALSSLVDSVSETLRSMFPEHGTLEDLQAASIAAVDAALGEFDTAVGFFAKYPEALDDRAYVSDDHLRTRPTVGERIDQLATLSIMSRLVPTERDLLLNSFSGGLHAAAWDFLDAAVRCVAGQKLGLLDSEDVKDTRLLYVCDGKVGKYFLVLAHSLNAMMEECLNPEEAEVSPLWSQDIATRMGGFDKAREMFDITSKFIELGRTGDAHFIAALEGAAMFEPTRCLA
ncbi:hypothetical protein D3C71_189690 [compost metagenome]